MMKLKIIENYYNMNNLSLLKNKENGMKIKN